MPAQRQMPLSLSSEGILVTFFPKVTSGVPHATCAAVACASAWTPRVWLRHPLMSRLCAHGSWGPSPACPEFGSRPCFPEAFAVPWASCACSDVRIWPWVLPLLPPGPQCAPCQDPRALGRSFPLANKYICSWNLTASVFLFLTFGTIYACFH